LRWTTQNDLRNKYELDAETADRAKAFDAVLTCGKCGKTEEINTALAAGWLKAQRKGAPTGHLIIRCPQHITGHALKLAGLPQQRTSRKVVDNLDYGLWTYYHGSRIAKAYSDGRLYTLAFHDGQMPAFKTIEFDTVEALIVAMREVEPDLRRWKVRKE
jgi:hypothetical protein